MKTDDHLRRPPVWGRRVETKPGSPGLARIPWPGPRAWLGPLPWIALWTGTPVDWADFGSRKVQSGDEKDPIEGVWPACTRTFAGATSKRAPTRGIEPWARDHADHPV